MTKTNTSRSVKGWDRRPWHDKSAADASSIKLFRTEMTHIYTGIIEGEGTIQFLFANNNEQGGCVALEKITGRVAGRSGSFVLYHTGTFSQGKAVMMMTVLPGTGTDELVGLSGHAVMNFTEHLDVYPIDFHYTFEERSAQDTE